MIMDQDYKDYIKHQLSLGQKPESIVLSLQSGGWEYNQAVAAVQQVSGITLARVAKNGYIRPPFSLRLMFWLSIVLAFVGLGILAVALYVFSENSQPLLGIVLVLVGLMYIAGFELSRRIKNGSLIALKVATGLLIMVVGVGVIAAFVESGFNAVDAAEMISETLGLNLFNGLFLTYIWRRHRAYFN